MIAIDTNVLVRLFVEDEPSQTVIAKKLFSENEIFVPVTVLLETEWVLRDAFGKSRLEIATAFDLLGNLPNVTLAEASAVERAMAWSRSGLDFGDALHLALSSEVEGLATFDQPFARKAAKITDAVPVFSAR